jgi:hypothetical protein
MKRLLIAFASASSIGLLIAACDVGGSWGYGGSGGYGGGTSTCSANTTCGTCTPISGCGWCTAPSGQGVCASDPDDCPTEQFTWTWDPNGCRVAADAGVGGSSEASTSDVSTTDTGVAKPDSAPSEAAVETSTGCTRDGSADASQCD